MDKEQVIKQFMATLDEAEMIRHLECQPEIIQALGLLDDAEGETK